MDKKNNNEKRGIDVSFTIFITGSLENLVFFNLNKFCKIGKNMTKYIPQK